MRRRSTGLLAQVYRAFGAGLLALRRRSIGLLAQVCFWGIDLRHPRPWNHVLRRRSPPFFLTCTNPASHLRQKIQSPAPIHHPTCANPDAYPNRSIGRPRKQQSMPPFVPDPTSRNQGLPRFRPQKGECVPEAAREELVHLIVSCGAGSQDFWRRSIGLAAQVHGTFGAGLLALRRRSIGLLAQVCFWGIDLRHPRPWNHVLRRRSPPLFLTCANPASHLRQNMQSPAPKHKNPYPRLPKAPSHKLRRR